MEERNQEQQILQKSDEKIQKVHCFLQRNYNSKPQLPSSIPIFQLLRDYLNDDDFIIFYQSQDIFKSQTYEQRLEKMYSEWKNQQQNNRDIDFFIEFWIKKEPELQLHFQLYHDLKKQNEDISIQISTPYFSTQSPKSGRKVLQKKSSLEQQNILGLKKIKSSEEFLLSFFNFYCKIQTSNLNNSTFDKYEQYYNQMNITKWMCYIRDVGYHKMFRKLKNNHYKSIFIKFQNTNKCLSFETFQKAVHNLLEIAYGNIEDEIKNAGYQLIGIKDNDSYHKKFKEIGVLAPLVKPKRSKTKSNQKISRNKSNKSQLHLSSFSNNINTETTLNSEFSSNSKNFVERNIRNASPNSSKLSLNKTVLTETQTSSHEQRKQIIPLLKFKNKFNIKDAIKEEEDDLYLQRYMKKQNLNHYHCISNRIDERINKIVRKY